MILRLALLLSSHAEAETIMYGGREITRHSLYRIVVRYLATQSYECAVQRFLYPDKKNGKGWGAPHLGAAYHEKTSAILGDIEAFLRIHGISSEGEIWEPVEHDE